MVIVARTARYKGWASVLTLGLLVAMVLVACSADTVRSAGADEGAVDAPVRAVPQALRASYLAARQNDGGEAYRFTRASSGGVAGQNRAHQLDVERANGALGITQAGSFHMALRWTGLGRGQRVAVVPGPSGEAEVAGHRASYLRSDGSAEWYQNGPLGVEQGFILPAPPEGSRNEPLAVEVSVEGDLAPVLVGDDGGDPHPPGPAGAGARIELRDALGATMARYSELSAFDAGGAPLRSWLEVSGSAIRLRVDDAGARYPLNIDPVVWTSQQELTASDAAASDMFGTSVSISGPIAIVGAPNHTVGSRAEAGAAYVFVQSGTTWTQQQELTAGDAAAFDNFGTAVAVSGTVAIVGSPGHTVGSVSGAGAAYVFVQSGTTWTQQQELTAGDAAKFDSFGMAVAVSGATALVGAPDHAVNRKGEAGAAYVFAQSGTTWAQQQELTAGDAGTGDQFGFSLAVSGTTALVGAYLHDVGTTTDAGAAYVFVQSGTTWVQQQELTAGDAAISDFFGFSVAVSGTTALVGAFQHNVGTTISAGAAYVFAQSGATWAEQQELTAGDAAADDEFGISVSVSAGTALVGAWQHKVGSNAQAGAAYTFLQSGTTWTQAQELTGSDGAASDLYGGSVSTSPPLVIVGAFQHEVGTRVQSGAAYVLLGAVNDGSGCYIDGTFYPAGAVDPANPCQVCTPATSATTFTPASDGTSCDTFGVCSSGACVDSSCQAVVFLSLDSGIEADQTCEDGVGSFTFTDTLAPGGPLTEPFDGSRALEQCAAEGASSTFLEFYVGPGNDPASFCFDYSAAGQADGEPARRWVAYWGCCVADTTLP